MDSVCMVSALDRFTAELGGLDEALLFSFLISVGIAVLLSPFYLMIYQAFVAMLMKVKDPQAGELPVIYAPASFNTLYTPVLTDLAAVMKVRYRRFNRTLIISLLFYSLGMILLVTLFGLDGESVAFLSVDGLTQRFALSLLVLLMVLPVLNQLFLPGWYRSLTGILLVIVVILAGIWIIIDESGDDVKSVLDNVALFLLLGGALAGFAVQKVRNVAAQISLAIQVFFISSFAYVLILYLLDSCILMPVFGPLEQDLREILDLVGVVIYFPLIYGLWRGLKYSVFKMVVAYERGLYSDFQLQTLLWLLLISLFFGALISADPTGDNALDQRSAYVLPVLLLSIVLYLLLNWRIKAWEPAQSLLYLRVFATDSYSENLLDYVAKHWRHIGPINMIGGPDFALFNLDIKEAYYLLFRRGDIHELFIDEPAVLEQRLATINNAPSADRQYVINEFFCTDNMWQPTVTELAGRSDHVLLDLRGFSAERKGAEFELHLLAAMDLLQYTTIVVDDQTDWRAIRSALYDLPDVEIPDSSVLEIKGNTVDPDIIDYLGRVRSV